jgi:LysM repeat protein
MKKTLITSLVICAVLVAVSCQSTGSAAGSNSDSAISADDAALGAIYERYESGIILTGAKPYTVVRGDTLSNIARTNYGAGNGYHFPLIIAASNETILDPDKIEPGMKLTIPDLQANLDNPQARGNLKNLIKDIADFYATKTDALSKSQNTGLTNLYNSL